MIVPIKIPPGAYRNGTEYEGRGRWRVAQLVRWRDGRGPRVVGGWQSYNPNATVGTYSNNPRGGLGWVDDSGNLFLAFGTYANAYVLEEDGTVTDLTPGGFTSGANTSTTWSWSTFGEIPLGCSTTDGVIYEWDLNTANNLTAVTNAPTGCLGVAVSQERFVFALGDGGDPRSIRWSDRDDRTVWTAAATNQAGGYDLDTEGEILFAKRLRGELLIVTSKDVWRATYVGYPDVYSVEFVGTGGAIGPLAGVAVDDRAFWWGHGQFYMYQGGYVQPLKCDILDFVNDQMDTMNWPNMIHGWHNVEFSEVWWHFPSSSGESVDSYVAYNYQEGYWHYGFVNVCFATTVVERGPWANPMGFHPDEFPSGDPITNGAFASDTGWTKTGDWAIAAGVASGTTGNMTQVVSGLTVGAKYRVKFTTASRTTGSLQVSLGGSQSITATTNGAQETILDVGSDKTITLLAGSSWDGTVDDVSIESVRIKEHETDYSFPIPDNKGSTASPYATSSPLDIANGERRVHITKIYPDDATSGDLTIALSAKEYPSATTTTTATVTSANPTSVRLSGRQFTIQVSPATAGSDWDSGIHRLELKPGGKR